MSQDSFSEVTNVSWLNRIGNSIKGVLIGLILIMVSLGVLFWNEGRAVKTYKTLKEGSGAVVSVSADAVLPENEGKLVHVTALATTDEVLRDPEFGVSAKALKLIRSVEMYQWKQFSSTKSRKKVGGGVERTTTYSYSRTWSRSLISSSSFKQPQEHENPAQMPFRVESQVARRAQLGAFVLPESFLNKLGNGRQLPIETDTPIPASLQGRASVADGGFYIGKDPANPEVGDVRVRFQALFPMEISVVAQQSGNTFEPYQTYAGGTIALVEEGAHPAASMFRSRQESNRMWTWILRIGGFLVLWFGLAQLFGPFRVLSDVLPFVGAIVGAGIAVVTLLIALAVSLFVIGLAWVFYRPLIGISLLVGVVVLLVLTGGKLRVHKQVASKPAA